MATVPLTPLEVAQGRLDAYLAAERKILLEAQQYQVGDGSAARMLLRARLQEVQAGIKDAREQLAVLQSTAPGRRRVLFAR